MSEPSFAEALSALCTLRAVRKIAEAKPDNVPIESVLRACTKRQAWLLGYHMAMVRIHMLLGKTEGK